MRPALTSLLGGCVSAQAFCSFHKGNAARKADFDSSFRLKLAFLLPSASQSGGFKIAVSVSRTASKFEQPEWV